jgi:hypothetical protein
MFSLSGWRSPRRDPSSKKGVDALGWGRLAGTDGQIEISRKPKPEGRSSAISVVMAGAIVAATLLTAACGGAAGRVRSTGFTTQPPPPPDVLIRELNNAVGPVISRWPLANEAFVAPHKLRMHQVSEVVLKLSLAESASKLQSSLAPLGRRTHAQIHVARKMTARLVGDGFGITPITSTSQFVDPLGVTKWEWNVEATSPGLHKLYLSLSGVVDTTDTRNGDTLAGDHLVSSFHRRITITTVGTSLWSELKRWPQNNYQWLIVGVMIPLVGLYLAYLDHKQKQKEKSA